MQKIILITSLFLITVITKAQPGKVQAAWRNLSDYESSFDTTSLSKANEAIQLALTNEKTKEDAKTWLYKSKIELYFFKEDYKKLELKNKGNSDVKEQSYQQTNAKFIDNAIQSVMKATSLDTYKTYENEIKILYSQLVQELNNVAYSKYKARKFEDAALLFSDQYIVTKQLGIQDTNVLYNAVLCATKTGKHQLTTQYAELMIKEKIANSFAYTSLFDAKLALNDSAGAMEAIKSGRLAFPNDTYLMNKETEFYIQQGNGTKALENLNKAITSTPNSATLYLVRGNVYDNMANPLKGDKPLNFEELMLKAEQDYKKACELDPANFDAWYNCGAVYNNLGSFYQYKADAIPKVNAEQKALAEKAQTLFKNAVSNLEKAMNINPNDVPTLTALRKLYLIIGEKSKSEQISEKLKK
jgi:tetratricopeptide (TPR) repeat protein